jgi:hypothetical protein
MGDIVAYIPSRKSVDTVQCYFIVIFLLYAFIEIPTPLSARLFSSLSKHFMEFSG